MRKETGSVTLIEMTLILVFVGIVFIGAIATFKISSSKVIEVDGHILADPQPLDKLNLPNS